MFEFDFLQRIRFGLWYSKTNRHGTHIFDLRIGTKDSYNSYHSKDFVCGRVRLNKSQEIQVDILTLSQCDTGSLGIFEEEIVKKLLSQINADQLIKLIK